MMESLLGSFVLCIIAGLLVYQKASGASGKAKGENSAYAGIWWFSLLISSFALYFVVFIQTQKLETQTTFSYIASTVVTSAGAAIRMFAFDFDYDDVREVADANKIYALAIFVCFIASSLWTTIMAKDIFFKGIANELKIWIRANVYFRKNEFYYIIVGHEKSMRLLLDDMQKSVSKNNMVIITGDAVEGGLDTQASYKELVSEGYAVIHGKADENSLKRAGVEKTKRKIRVVAITESDEQNLNIAEIITDKISSIISQNKESPNSNSENAINGINLEAYIMYSFIERTEHFAFAESARGKVDFFNPYELRARDFFWKHPITNFIPDLIDTSKARLKGELGADGKIRKADGREYLIKNIFVGFGRANCQMLKGSILTGQLLGCDYNATVYDVCINADVHANKPSVHQSIFANHSSGLFGGDETLDGEEYFASPNEKYNISFRNGNALAREFYSLGEYCLVNEVKNNDFTTIFVSLGDDKLSIETACEIRQCLYEYGTAPEKVRIFVKIKEESAFSKDSVINNPKNIPIRIECFGFDSSVFTENNITNEPLNCFAQKVANKNHETPWGSLTETKRDINRQVAMAINMKLNLLGFELEDINTGENAVSDDDYYAAYRGAEQNEIAEIIRLSVKIAKLNNSIETMLTKTMLTKMKQAKKSEIHGLQEEKGDLEPEINPLESLERLKDERSKYKLDYVQTENGENDGIISDTPRNNLARLEHQRWNTFHLIHGWTKKPKGAIGADNSGRQDKLSKRHACITTFEELVNLRKLQAEKALEEKPDMTFEIAEAKADTIWYDYNLMDELPARLENSDKQISLSKAKS